MTPFDLDAARNDLAMYESGDYQDPQFHGVSERIREHFLASIARIEELEAILRSIVQRMDASYAPNGLCQLHVQTAELEKFRAALAPRETT